MLYLIVFSLILLFFCLYLYLDNKEIKNKLTTIETTINILLDNKSTPNQKAPLIEPSSNEVLSPSQEDTKIELEYSLLEEESQEGILEEKNTSVAEIPPQIEPTQIEDLIKPVKTRNLSSNQDITTDNFNPTDFIPSSKQAKTPSYLEELSNQTTKEIPPQAIELTNYEKLEEEQAVISYQELINRKENNSSKEPQVFQLNNDKDFIEALKDLRNSLNN